MKSDSTPYLALVFLPLVMAFLGYMLWRVFESLRNRRLDVQIGDIYHQVPTGPKHYRYPHGELFVVARIGTIYDFMANIARGFEGPIYSKVNFLGGYEPMSLNYKIAASYFRSQVKKGNLKLVARCGEVKKAQQVVKGWASQEADLISFELEPPKL